MADLAAEIEQVRLEKTKLEERNQLLEKVLALNKQDAPLPTKGLLELVRHVKHGSAAVKLHVLLFNKLASALLKSTEPILPAATNSAHVSACLRADSHYFGCLGSWTRHCCRLCFLQNAHTLY